MTALNADHESSGGAGSPLDGSFATSALVRAPIDGAHFDARPLGLVDHFEVAQTLGNAKGVKYRLEPHLSEVVTSRWYADVLALHAILTFVPVGHEPAATPNASPVGRPPARLGAPAPTETVTIAQQVLLRPEPEGFETQVLNAAAGSIPAYVVHRHEEVAKRDARRLLTPRFRLERRRYDEPAIVFLVDPRMPEEIRDCVIDGGNWWVEAFADAGFPGAFEVRQATRTEELHDPHYSAVYWTHRVDRGWSFGKSQIDPRTGEILKGVVRLGSQRVEQVRAIAEALLAPYPERAAEVDRVVKRRIKALAAHEIGHCLGFAHNFASHSHSLPSVMDYPAPKFDVEDGVVRPADDVYPTRLGPWDHFQLSEIYRGTSSPLSERMAYVTDADSRLDDAASADGATWVIPGEAEVSFTQVLNLREAALKNFSPATVPNGADAHDLLHRFTLVYLVHRHQAIALSKLVGGNVREYSHVLDGHFSGAVHTVPGDQQRRALHELAQTLRPAFLRIPHHIAQVLAPPAGGAPPKSGAIESNVGGGFDAAAAIATAADIVLAPLLAPTKLNRVSQQNAYEENLTLAENLQVLLHPILTGLDAPERTFETEVVGWLALQRLKETASSDDLHEHVRIAIAEWLLAFGARRTVLKQRVEELGTTLLESVGNLPVVPLGAPI